MSEYDDTNRFVLFKNDKEGNEKRPDYTGKLTLPGGHVMRMSAWIRDGKNGKFMSGQIEEQRDRKSVGDPKEAGDRVKEYQKASPTNGGFDDPLPF